jgi:GT2 family glycosyltransferase
MHDHPVVDASGPEPEVTVVVPVFNGAATIAACLSSLLALLYPRERFEIIVVDNGSTDHTREVLKAFGDAIRVQSETTLGAAAARNRGVLSARGRLIAFIDADCVAEPEWLTAIVAPLSDLRVGVVGGRILSPAGGNRIEHFGELIHDQQRAIEAYDPPYVNTASWASRREVLLEIGLFDETLLRGQDVDLAWRIHRAGLRLVYARDAVVHHRHESTVFGLMHEGFVHGRSAVSLSLKHTHVWPQIRRRWTTSVWRLAGDLREIARGQAPMDSLLWFLFDAGKSTGELIALAKGSPEGVPGGHTSAENSHVSDRHTREAENGVGRGGSFV